ncbi:uncharacterized protein J3R85_014188 [Psidium guajava]|nr:uncharacterized protein J3R85_014188 [Psidium guajava]
MGQKTPNFSDLISSSRILSSPSRACSLSLSLSQSNIASLLGAVSRFETRRILTPRSSPPRLVARLGSARKSHPILVKVSSMLCLCLCCCLVGDFAIGLCSSVCDACCCLYS